MEDIIIENCGECPFFRCGEDLTCYGCYCDHPKAPEHLDVTDYCNDDAEEVKCGFPKGCPLTIEGITIKRTSYHYDPCCVCGKHVRGWCHGQGTVCSTECAKIREQRLWERFHVHYVTWSNKYYRDNFYWHRLIQSAKKVGVDLVICDYEKLDIPEYVDVRGVELGYFLQHPDIQAARPDDGIMLIGGDQAFIQRPHDLPPLDDNIIYMPYNITPEDTLLNDIKRRRGNADIDNLKETLQFNGSEPTRNTGSAYASKQAWVNLHEKLKPKIKPFSELFGSNPVWQSLLSATAYRLGFLKVMPMKFGAHDHGELKDLGLKIVDGKVYTVEGEPAQILHKFKEISI